MNRKKNSILGLSETKNAEFLDTVIAMSIQNFMLSWVEHENVFITSGVGTDTINFHILLQTPNGNGKQRRQTKNNSRFYFPINGNEGTFNNDGKSKTNWKTTNSDDNDKSDQEHRLWRSVNITRYLRPILEGTCLDESGNKCFYSWCSSSINRFIYLKCLERPARAAARALY